MRKNGRQFVQRKLLIIVGHYGQQSIHLLFKHCSKAARFGLDAYTDMLDNVVSSTMAEMSLTV